MPLDSSRGNTQQTGSLSVGQTNEKSELYHLRTLRGLRCQFFECVVQTEDAFVIGRCGNHDFIQLNPMQTRSVSRAQMATSTFDEDVTHGLGRGSKEVPAAFPSVRLATFQAKPGLVHQGCGLESLAWRLLGNPDGSQATEFIIH
jgi:hypothetical protein